MDKLEAYKATNASNDAVVDDVAAKAYIENFALETFNRGDEAQRTNKVTRQTADTFQASATFMDLLSIWDQLEPEIQAKQKYAKFHALRIAKAFKAGEDPNTTNPLVQKPQEPDLSLEEGLDAELKNLENDAGLYRPPSVESAPDSGLPSRPPQVLSPTVPPQPGEPDVSPIEPPSDHANSRAASIGGGYFPTVPDAPSTANTVPAFNQAPTDPADFYGNPPAPSIQNPTSLGITTPDRPSAPTPHQMIQPSVPHPVSTPQFSVHPTPPVQANAPLQSFSSAPPPGGYTTDDDSIMAAQKHAKWAISALNFEDVNTAVKELRIALQNLGAG